MDKNFVFFGVLASILIGGSLGVFPVTSSFAEDDDLHVSAEDSEAYKKQLERAEEKRKELEEKKKERQEKLEEKKKERQEKAEEKRKKLEERKLKLESDRKKLEEKLNDRLKKYEEKYEEKLKRIKEKFANKIESDASGNVESFSAATAKLDEKFAKKTEEIREKLSKKSAKLDSRIQKVLDKIDDGNYLGKKIGSSTTIETYELVFDSVTATGIGDKTTTSSLTGFMNFKTFDKGKSNLKLELQECQITVDNVPYNCGFGKARTTSSGDSGSKDSLVILAFLEDDVLEEVHSTLKIFVDAGSPIRDIESSQVSILGPQSKISHMWFLDGTGTLTKTISDFDNTGNDSTDDTTDDSEGNAISVELTESIGLKN